MKNWRYDAILQLARSMVSEDAFVTRKSILGALNEGELQDEDYWADGLDIDRDGFQIVSIEKTIWKRLLEMRPGMKVEIFEPKSEDCDLRSSLMSYCKEYEDNRAQVVLHNQSGRLCVRRFLEAKELAHVLTDTVVCDTKSHNLVADAFLEQSLDGRNFIRDFNEPLTPEAVGFYLAIEVLLPWCRREELNEMFDSGATNLQIAKAFMVPQFIIRHVRNVAFNKVSYLGVSYDWNNRI